MSARPSSAVALLALLLACALPAAAQESVPAADTTRPASLDRVLVVEPARATAAVGSRLGLAWRRTPASVDVVEQRALQTLGRNTIVEAVRGLPGITSAYRPGAAGVFSSRGFVENAVGVLFDGVRVQSATVTMRAYDAFNFERVEVLRGPASALYGEGAAAGAVNFVRRKPRPGPLAVEVLAQGGGGGVDQLRGGAAVTGSLGTHAEFVASGSGSWFGTPYDGNRHAYRHAIAGVRVRPTSRTSVLVEGDRLDNAVRDAYWGVPLVNDRIDETLAFRNFNRAPDTRYVDRVGWGRAVVDHALGARAAYSGQLFTYRADRDWRNFYAFRYVPAAGTAPAGVERRFAESLAYEHAMSGTRQQLTVDHPIGARAARTVVGVELARTDFSSPRAYGPRAVVGVDGPVTPTTPAAFPARLDDRRADVRAAQLFVENRADLHARVTLVSAVNASRVALDVARPASRVAFARTFTPVSGRVAVVGDVGAGGALYAQYATGSEPVSALVILAPAESSFALTRTRQVEIGSRHVLWAGRATATAALYAITRTNLLTADAVNPAATVQVGEQSARGAELTLTVRPTPAWHVEGNAALVRARYDRFREGADVRDGLRPPNVPGRVLNGGASYRAASRVTVGAWATHVGPAVADNSNAVALPAYTLADAWARVDLARGVDVTARVKNALDARYVDWATRSAGQTNVYFGVPRSVEATLRLHP